jgi:outer membrane protein
MTKRFLFITTICLGIFSATKLSAQDSSVTQTPGNWTLQACIDYAKRHNIQLNSLRLAQQSSEQDLLQSKAAKLPDLSGSISQSVTGNKNTNSYVANSNSGVGGFQSQANFAGNYSLNSSWVLYNGGYINNDIKEKNLLTQSANLDILQTQNDITLQITQAFLNILLAKENIVYVQDLIKTSQSQLQQGQQRFDAGAIAKKDVVQLQAQLANDKYTLVTSQNNLRQDELTLKQILQLPSSYDFEISAPDTLITEKVYPPLEEAENQALQTRPEVRNGELNVQVAQTDLNKAKAGVLPKVSVGASLATGYSDYQTGKYTSQLDNNFYQQLGITVSIPIFSNRINKTNIEKSKIQIDQAKLSLQNTKTVLSQEVEQSYINVLNAQSQYSAAEKQLEANQESYRITNEEFKIGSVNMVDLLQQKNLYVQALQGYIQAKYNTILSLKIYKFYTGVPVSL